jgi:hypothetical protein
LLQVSAPPPTAPTQNSTPFWHWVVPAMHTPASVPQLAPPPGLPSSTAPSQSLSTPSQVSTPPPVGLHWYSQPGTAGSTSTKPGSHAATSHAPAWQSALAWSRLQTLPQRPQLFSSVVRLKSSSIALSQSLSRSSHTSTPPLVGMQKYSHPAVAGSVSFQPGWHAPGVQVPMAHVPNACG